MALCPGAWALGLEDFQGERRKGRGGGGGPVGPRLRPALAGAVIASVWSGRAEVARAAARWGPSVRLCVYPGLCLCVRTFTHECRPGDGGAWAAQWTPPSAEATQSLPCWAPAHSQPPQPLSRCPCSLSPFYRGKGTGSRRAVPAWGTGRATVRTQVSRSSQGGAPAVSWGRAPGTRRAELGRPIGPRHPGDAGAHVH